MFWIEAARILRHWESNPTEKEHLNLVALHHLVALKLVLNLLIAGLPLLILCTHTTTHDGGVMWCDFSKRNDRDGSWEAIDL